MIASEEPGILPYEAMGFKDISPARKETYITFGFNHKKGKLVLTLKNDVESHSIRTIIIRDQ